ncbi:hypothetical protein ACLIA0_02650 [Bacillaceae bacterium W0354]
MMQQPHISHMFQTVRLNRKAPSVLKLHDGQLVTGKMIKFFQGNKALIQISNHQIVAEVDTPLVANQNYLLQVKNTKPSIVLQVVRNDAIQNSEEAANIIMRQFNIKNSRQVHAMLSQIFKNELPVKTNMVESLINLIKNNHGGQYNVLKELIIRQLPLTQTVYKTVEQRLNQTLSFSQTIEQVQNQLMMELNTNEKIKLHQYLNLFSGKQVTNDQLFQSLIFQILEEVGKGSETTFQLFKQAGIVQEQTTYHDWSKQWRTWAQSNQEPIFQLKSNEKLPFQITTSMLISSINELSNNQLPKAEINVLRSLVNLFNSDDKQMSVLADKIRPHLSILKPLLIQMTEHSSFVNHLVAALERGDINQISLLIGSAPGQQLLEKLNSMMTKQVATIHERALTFWKSMVLSGFDNRRSTLISQQLKMFLQLSQSEGLQSNNLDYPSIQTLLQAVKGQASNQQLGDHIQKLQQIFQAIHLSFNEGERDWLQFTTHFPKELLGLKEDLWMDFEGKREKDGKIDAAHCRVLFYLHLPNLDETVIDMQVQNRNVLLTIYNHKEHQVKESIKPLLQQLENELLQKQYLLTHFQVLPYRETKVGNHNNLKTPYSLNYSEGIDYKV